MPTSDFDKNHNFADRQCELIRAAQRGCTDSFAILAQAYSARLLGFLYQKTGSHQDAEDLLQETFLRCMRHIKNYDCSKSFTTWLFTIASRLALNYRQKPFPRLYSSLSEMPCAGTESKTSLEEQETTDALWSAVRRLPELQAQAVQLHYLGEMPVKQVAEVMGLTAIHVRVLLYRARKSLIRYYMCQDTVENKNISADSVPCQKVRV